jgi:hypothetical protein
MIEAHSGSRIVFHGKWLPGDVERLLAINGKVSDSSCRVVLDNSS